MQYQHDETRSFYLLRLDPDEEIVATLKRFCADVDIRLGTVSGLGALSSVTLGFFHPVSKQYQQRTFTEFCEMTSLVGNITQQNGVPYLHLHGNFAGADFRTFGGHLSAGSVSSTAEICIHAHQGEVDRHFSTAIGLNLLTLEHHDDSRK